MGKGRYLKSAERACSAKARFDTPLDAERACEWRFRAYACAVCGGYHLTSQSGPATTERDRPAPPPSVKGPTLAELDWSALKGAKPKPARPAKPKKPVYVPPPPPPAPIPVRCASNFGKDGRVKLVIDGRLVKSARVQDPFLRQRIKEGVVVLVAKESDPPRIVGLSN